jgi:Ca2+-binding RTX toxin-like protein
MKKSPTIAARKIRQALASGIVLSAGVSSLLHAQQAEKGKDWLQKMSSRNGNNPSKSIKAKVQDALHGNSGNDLMMRSTPGCATTGTTGNDTIALGGTYCDTAFGLAGEDLFYGYSTSTTDTLVADGGSGADDIQIYSYGPVIAYGGSEDDIAYVYTYGSVFGDGGDGNDNFEAYAYYGDIILVGDLGDDALSGRTYASIYVDAGDGSDDVTALCLYGPAVTLGGLEADQLVSGSYEGDNTMFGGDGNDYMYGVSVNGVRNFMDGGQGDDQMAVGVYYTYAGYGTAYTYNGSYLYGGMGNDALLAHVGNDTLVGGPGSDVMRAYGGDDLLVAANSGFAMADGGPGTDLLTTDFDHGADQL